MATTIQETKAGPAGSPWHGFRGGLWQKQVDIRDYIQANYEPYDGDGAFLAPATARTKALWARLEALFVEERKKGVLDVSPVPSSITAHGPGYLDRENEVVVGLQTEAPLKRAIMPNGGFRMVLGALKAYGYEPEPHVVDAFTKYRKTHNDAVFDAYTADIRRCRSAHILTGLPVIFPSWEGCRFEGQGVLTKLLIYDVLGREIETLVNDELIPGMYEAEFDGTKYPSGVYYYRIAIHSDKLQAWDFSETKKMILVK